MRTRFVVLSLVLVATIALVPAASPAFADGLTQQKAKATREAVVAKKQKLEKARDAIRALADVAPPKELTVEQRKAYSAEMAKLRDAADATEEVTTKLALGLKDAKPNFDSLAELGEEQQLRLQMVMDRMSKAMSTLSNLLKKVSDTANGIVENLK